VTALRRAQRVLDGRADRLCLPPLRHSRRSEAAQSPLKHRGTADRDYRSGCKYSLSDGPTDGGDRGRYLEFLQYAATVANCRLEAEL
jgi:hypothetical protein